MKILKIRKTDQENEASNKKAKDNEEGPMATSRQIMKWLGTWQDPPSDFLSWFTLRGMLFKVSTMFYALSGILKLTTDFQNIASSAFAMTASTISIHAITRLIVYSAKAKSLKDLVESIEELYKNAKDKQWKKDKLNQAKKVSDKITFYYFNSFQIVVWIQLITHSIINWRAKENKYVFELWSPFPANFWGQLFQFYYIYSSILNMTQAYNLLTSFTFQITGHIEILNQELQMMKNHFGKATYDNAIKHCIKLHSEIIRLVKVENEVVSLGLFMEFFCVSVMACTSLYIGQQGSVKDKMTGYVAFMVALAMPAILCWCGSILEDQSESICFNAYSSGWEDANPKERKMLLCLMCAANRNLTLRITPGFMIGLKQYSSFLQTTYSFMTGIRTLENNT